MIPTPRTFKNALAAQEKMHGPVKMEVRVAMFAFVVRYRDYSCTALHHGTGKRVVTT